MVIVDASKLDHIQAFLKTRPPIECATIMMGTWPILPSLPSLYFMWKSRSLAKSPIVKDARPFFAAKFALYPNVKMRAVERSGSSGSHLLGQRDTKSRSLLHVRRLLPPRPWMNKMSTVRHFDSGTWRTVRPIGSSRRSCERYW